MNFGAQPFTVIYPLAVILALTVSLICTPLVGRLAVRLGVVAYPQRDRWHRVVTPLLGGIAIFLMSAASSYVNGAVIPVDGGLTAVL